MTKSNAPKARIEVRNPSRGPNPAQVRSPGVPSGFVRRVARWRVNHGDNKHTLRLGRALLLLCCGLMLIGTSAYVDPVLHRGVETGEEAPFVVQSTGRELSVNVDLTRFDPAGLNSVLETLQTSGFVNLRQPVSWASIESTQGSYNWGTLDSVVDGVNQRGMQLVFTIQDTPSWARRASEQGYADAPPSGTDSLSAFAAAIADRYGSRVQFYQFFDRPNLSSRWGGAAPSASEYVQLLAAAFGAVRSNNSDARIVLAELDPRGESGVVGDDFAFLAEIYEVGGDEYFDIASLQLDGGTNSPSDRTVSAERLNLSRAIAMRDYMIDQNDSAKPIWATRYGWASSASLSESKVASYLVEGIDRARTEWPWMGPMFAWSLTQDAESAPYALLTADGSARPQYSALSRFGMSERARIAPTGFAPMLSSAVSYDGTWREQHLNRQVFQTTSETNATLRLTFHGTGVQAILRNSPDAGEVRATLDGNPLGGGFPVEDGKSVIDLTWFQAIDVRTLLVDGLSEGNHVLELTLAGEGSLTIGGMLVTRQQPLVWPIMLMLIVGLILLIVALHELVLLIATRWGHFMPRAGLRPGPIWGQFSERWTGRGAPQ